MRHVSILLLLTFASGCTATLSTARLVEAQRAVARAEERGAEELAPYELTLAREVLEKAREEHQHNAFRTAADLAQRAADHADRAVVILQSQSPEVTEAPAEPTEAPAEPTEASP